MSMVSSGSQTVNVGFDRVKVFLAMLLVVVGVAAFYLLSKYAMSYRVLALVGCMLLSVILMITTVTGSRFLAFSRESYREALKVTWPERKEVTQMTAIVFGFVLVMAVLLWFMDKSLEYLLYGVILGWRG